MCKRQVQYNRIPITRMLNAMPIYKKNPAGTDSKTDLALPYAEARRSSKSVCRENRRREEREQWEKGP